MKQKLRRIAAMTAANTGRAFRTPGDVIWMLVVPVIFSLIIATFFLGSGGTQTLYVVVEDQSDSARRFVEGISARPYAVREVTRDEAEAGLNAGEYEVVLVVPQGFSDGMAEGKPRLELIHGPGYEADEVEAWAKAVAFALAHGEPLPAVDVTHESPRGVGDTRALVKVRTSFGVYVVFAFAALFARGGGLHQERQDGTLQRVVAAGVPYGEVVAAHVASLFLIGLLQAGIVLGITGALGTPWLTAGWDVLALTFVGTIFVAAGLALALSGLTRSATLMQGLAGGLPPLLAMMGGAFFPLEVAPVALQRVARINPIYWATELVSEGYLYQGVSSQVIPLVVLLLIGVLGTVVGIQGLRRIEL